MKTRLTATVPVQSVIAAAEVAVLERRPELGRLCAAATTAKGLTPEMVDAALPGLSLTGARNLIAHCRYLGLCDDGGALTPAGRYCAATGEAPTPEQGVYRFWLAEHPLFGWRLLHFERVQPDPRDTRFDELEPLPPILKPDRRQIWASALDRELRFTLRTLLGPKGRLAAAPPGNLVWEIDFAAGSNAWSLEGILVSEERRDSRSERFATVREPLAELDPNLLFRQWYPAWDPVRRRAAIHFATDTRFEQECSFGEVDVPGRGAYREVLVTEVPVGPVDTQHAQRWADALVEQRVASDGGYVTRASVRRAFDEAIRGTPLEPFRPSLRAHVDALRALDSDAKRTEFWLRAAPIDLAPTPVSDAALAAETFSAHPRSAP